MKRAHLLSLAGSIACFLCSVSFANPIPVTALSEIQLIDSLHWTVEVDCRNLSLYPGLSAGATDTVTLYCSLSPMASPLDSMPKCVKPGQVDTNGMMLLTPQHFPGLKIKKGWTVFLGVRGVSYGAGQALIPQDLTPQGSLVCGYQTYCCQVMNGNCIMTCSSIIYTVSSCPSIGIRNNGSTGSIAGTVQGNASVALTMVRAYLKSSPTQAETYVVTDENGVYRMSSLDLCHTYFLRFTDGIGTPISDTLVGPLQLTAGKTLTVNVNLNYSPPTAAHPRGTRNRDVDAAVKILPSAIGNRIMLTISGNAVAQQGTIDILSTNGSILRSISFALSGPGTYTVPWDGRNGQNHTVPAGTYVCRAQIGKDISCKGFVTR